MTEPVSSGARWPRNDLSCYEPSEEERETFTCDETNEPRCAAERAQRVTQPYAALTESPAPRFEFCRDADTVVEGFLCGEPIIVSNACRKPTNAFDEFVCDEPRMRELQWTVLRETWNIVKTLALALLRGKP
jgi:hypothetical protein